MCNVFSKSPSSPHLLGWSATWGHIYEGPGFDDRRSEVLNMLWTPQWKGRRGLVLEAYYPGTAHEIKSRKFCRPVTMKGKVRT